MKRFLLVMAIAFLYPVFVTSADARSNYARSNYDGSWNLVFFTQYGPCDPTYNFSVNISNGIITQPNLVRFRGYVSRAGAVRASVAVQEKYATGSGRLVGATGHGTWKGRAGNAQCAGSWTAQRN
jgi:hypothetical protein